MHYLMTAAGVPQREARDVVQVPHLGAHEVLQVVCVAKRVLRSLDEVQLRSKYHRRL